MSTVVLPVSSASEQNLAAEHSEVLLAAGAQSWELTPERWVQQQLLRLALASVLEARLLNVKSSRLAAFDLSADPDTVTLTQLAALHRAHSGTAGQAFELAVADACNAGVAEVAGPLEEALRLLGVVPDAPPRLQVLGLEKIPPLHAAEIAAQMRVQLPPDGVLRTGGRGRPANVDTVVARLTQATWSAVPKPIGYERQESQLPRADALLTSGSTMVPVSIKINERAVFRPGWAGVPIWITLTHGLPTRILRQENARYPLVEVRLGQGDWSAMFYEALRLLDVVARQLDVGRSPRFTDQLSGFRLGAPLALQLVKLRSEPISAVAEELRRVHPIVLERAEADTAVGRSVLNLPVLDAAGLHTGWQQEADEGALFVGQRHLFLPAGRGGGRPPGQRSPLLG